MTDNKCGCPHPAEERGTCEVGEFCNHDDCRCVDGTYYGLVSDPESLPRLWKHAKDAHGSRVMKSVQAIAQHYDTRPEPNLVKYEYQYTGSAQAAIRELIANLVVDLEWLIKTGVD